MRDTLKAVREALETAAAHWVAGEWLVRDALAGLSKPCPRCDGGYVDREGSRLRAQPLHPCSLCVDGEITLEAVWEAKDRKIAALLIIADRAFPLLPSVLQAVREIKQADEIIAAFEESDDEEDEEADEEESDEGRR